MAAGESGGDFGLGAKGLGWTGILRPEQVVSLIEEFSDLVICPGYCPRFGGQSDEWGRVYIPGASAGYSVAKQKLEGWRERGSTDERWKWWPEAMKSKGIVPITAGDILRGIPASKWKEYCKVYSKASKVRMMKRRRKEVKNDAMKRFKAADKGQDGAGVLTGLVTKDVARSAEDPDRDGD